MKVATPDLTPTEDDQAYIDECLRLFKQKTSDLNLTEIQYRAFTEKIQLRLGCWNAMYWFRMENYPALQALNASYVG